MNSNPNHQPIAASGNAYVFSTTEKAKYAWESLGQRLVPREKLIAGPFGGEFGYELMQWQGYVRARRAHYREVHVITYPGRDYLYEGCQISAHDIALPKAGYGYGLLSPSQAFDMARQTAAKLGWSQFDVFLPAHLCTQYHKRLFWRQEFRLLHEPSSESAFNDVAFHFRAVRKEGPDHAKNYRPELADELIARCLEAGLSTVCIGHPDYAYCARGSTDQRSVDLKETVVALGKVRAVAGENSGPMHLANLCGKPTILWAQDQWRIDYSLRWNPFRVPIYVACNEAYQPEPKLIVGKIVEALADLKMRTNNFSQPAYTLPAQPISYF